jgi:3-phenylpropionate/trans-cinnamate dioxygenase ferredoxin subunit
MTEFITVAKTDELKVGDPPIVVDVENTWVAIYNIDGEYFAIEDTCTHDGNPLAEGTVEGSIVTCPRHGAKFDIKTGKCLSIYADVRTYQVRVVGDEIQVGRGK